ncbi:MAG: hypothetical protein K2X81_14925, partial [Candidatus Obscuribacterales bacterium]|nr:hypothetical protein [Candidatus Obscuribacterales bacterium]
LVSEMRLHKLEQQIEKYADWLSVRESGEHDANVHQYPGLWRLRCSFVEFLQRKSPTEWDDHEDDVAARAVRVDWHYQAMMYETANSELCRLAVLSYPSQSVRMYMLVAVNRIDDAEMRRDTALHFFEHDESETIRDYALEVLSRSGWDRAEETALTYWNNGFTTRRIVALRVLKNVASPKLKDLLRQAMEGSDPAVAYAANAISSLAEQ